jgi:hypothetical protein
MAAANRAPSPSSSCPPGAPIFSRPHRPRAFHRRAAALDCAQPAAAFGRQPAAVKPPDKPSTPKRSPRLFLPFISNILFRRSYLLSHSPANQRHPHHPRAHRVRRSSVGPIRPGDHHLSPTPIPPFVSPFGGECGGRRRFENASPDRPRLPPAATPANRRPPEDSFSTKPTLKTNTSLKNRQFSQNSLGSFRKFDENLPIFALPLARFRRSFPPPTLILP